MSTKEQTVFYEYKKTTLIEDEVSIPCEVIAKGDAAIRAWINETVCDEDYDYTAIQEHTELKYRVEK